VEGVKVNEERIKMNILTLLWSLRNGGSLAIYDLERKYEKYFGLVNEGKLLRCINELVEEGYLEEGITYGFRWVALSRKGIEFVKKVLES
jgi:DNA-binding PadR family transcriptional regulator